MTISIIVRSFFLASGGSGGSHQPAYPPNQPSGGDNLSGTIGSLLGGVLGGGGGGGSHQQYSGGYQPSGGYGGYQPSSGYPPGGQSSTGSDFLSGIGSAIGSSLFSSALDGLKHGKDVSINYLYIYYILLIYSFDFWARYLIVAKMHDN